MGIKKMLATAALAVCGVASVFAEDAIVGNTIVLPSGVDIKALITSGVGVLSGIVAVALAAWGSWLIVRKCLKWVRKSF